MKCIISFAAEGIILDSRTNNISAFNILESLASPGFPLFIQKMFFFSLLLYEIETDEGAVLKLVVKNNDQLLIDIPTSANFKKKNRTRQIVQIGGMAIPTTGTLSFHLMKEANELCSYSIEVNKIGDPKVENIE